MLCICTARSEASGQCQQLLILNLLRGIFSSRCKDGNISLYSYEGCRQRSIFLGEKKEEVWDFSLDIYWSWKGVTELTEVLTHFLNKDLSKSPRIAPSVSVYLARASLSMPLPSVDSSHGIKTIPFVHSLFLKHWNTSELE